MISAKPKADVIAAAAAVGIGRDIVCSVLTMRFYRLHIGRQRDRQFAAGSRLSGEYIEYSLFTDAEISQERIRRGFKFSHNGRSVHADHYDNRLFLHGRFRLQHRIQVVFIGRVFGFSLIAAIGACFTGVAAGNAFTAGEAGRILC